MAAHASRGRRCGNHVDATNDSQQLIAISDEKIRVTCKNVRNFVEDHGAKYRAEVNTSYEVSDAEVTSKTGGFYTVLERVDCIGGGEIDIKTGKVLEKFKDETQHMFVNMQ